MRTLQAYLDGLLLTVTMTPVLAVEAPSVAALLTKTSSFNLHARAVTAEEIVEAIDQRGLRLQLVTASDRLGQYDEAGVLATKVSGDVLDVEELALSCRVLGKGVEYEVLTNVVRMARESGAREVRFHLRAGPRNDAACRFVDHLREHGSDPDDADPEAPSTIAVDALETFARARGSAEEDRRPRRRKPFSLGKFVRRRWNRLDASGRNRVIDATARELQAEEQLLGALEETRAERTNGASAEFVGPRDALEQVVAQIWREVLGVPRVGIHDHFFDLGGHSLLITQVLARLRESLDVEVPIHQVFVAPTVAQLAEVISSQAGDRQRLNDEAMLLMEVASLSSEELEMAMSSRQTS